MRRSTISALWVLLLIAAALLAAQKLGYFSPATVIENGRLIEPEDRPQALDRMIYTLYHPIASDTGNKTIEGGSLDMFENKIITASDVLDARAQGDSTAGDANHPVTLAGDPSHSGEVYFIPTLTYTTVDSDGRQQTFTLNNFYGRVSDTGSAFTGRPEKIDIAADHAPSQAIANKEDRLNNNTNSVELIPANAKARAFAESHGSVNTSSVLEKPQDSTLDSKAPVSVREGASSGPSIPPFWRTSPYCAKHFGPSGPPKVAIAPSCNGGLLVVPPEPPVPVADCGEGGVLCTVPTGCLNLVCAANGNALYDPVTKICGCG